MIDIKYVPGRAVDGKKHVLQILYGADDKASIVGTEFVTIRKQHMSEDIQTAQTKIRAIRTLWATAGGREVTIHVSSKLLHASDEASMCSITSSIINQFMPDKLIQRVTVIVTHAGTKKHTVLEECIHLTQHVLSARMLGMLPPNVATPRHMAYTCKRMFRGLPRCKVRVFDQTALEKEGFGLILGVGNSARNKPTFVFIERPAKSGTQHAKRVAVVGKGITFDSGGLALKPLKSMVDMKFDKLGATYSMSILLHLIADPRWDHVSFYGALPFAENAVSASALRPGDVIKSYDGTTVEVSNPDAEGRLVLADAFGFLAKKCSPDFIIDLATLTGHASMISCWHTAYFYSNSRSLRDAAQNIGERCGEHMISMPSWSRQYSSVLKSNVADIVNSPIACSDANIAAMFLEHFIPNDTDWVHFDLAHQVTPGTSIATGQGIRTILFLIHHYLSGKKV